MPRTIPTGLQTSIGQTTLTLCWLVSITRQDGTILSFTSNDEPVIVSGVTYEPANSKYATSIKSSAGQGIDNLDFLGSIDSTLIKEQDLMGGLYDCSKVIVSLVDYTNPTGGTTVLLEGFTGQIRTISDLEFHLEVRSLSQRLQLSVGDQVAPTCRCRNLGDVCCRFNLASNTALGFVTQTTLSLTAIASDNVTLQFAAGSFPTGYFAFGTLEGSSGSNIGFTRSVKTHTIGSGVMTLVLTDAFPYPVSVGDTFLATAGCDRLFTTCVSKFNNANNFHGEPSIPTNDLVQVIGNPNHT